MTNRRTLPKIVKKVEGQIELDVDIFVNWSAECLITNYDLSVEVRDIEMLCHNNRNQEVELSSEEIDSLKDTIEEDATTKVLESLEASDFDDSEEEY